MPTAKKRRGHIIRSRTSTDPVTGERRVTTHRRGKRPTTRVYPAKHADPSEERLDGGKLSVTRVYLDSGGYERGGGQYFGHDREDVYRVSVDNGGYQFIRARDRKDALAKARKIADRIGKHDGMFGGLGMMKAKRIKRDASGKRIKKAPKVNREGLTWSEWKRAAGGDAYGAKIAWSRGEDPTDWRASLGYTGRGRRASDGENHTGAYLLFGGMALVMGFGIYAAVKA